MTANIYITSILQIRTTPAIFTFLPIMLEGCSEISLWWWNVFQFPFEISSWSVYKYLSYENFVPGFFLPEKNLRTEQLNYTKHLYAFVKIDKLFAFRFWGEKKKKKSLKKFVYFPDHPRSHTFILLHSKSIHFYGSMKIHQSHWSLSCFSYSGQKN